jgi:hypothetical protein
VKTVAHDLFLHGPHEGERSRPEGISEHRSVLEQRLSFRGEGVQASGDDCLDRVGEPGSDVSSLNGFGRESLFGQHPDELLCVEWVPLRPLEDQAAGFGSQLQFRGGQQGRQQLFHLFP